MSEGNSQRIFLTCGSILLLVFCFAAALSIVSSGPGDNAVLIAVITLTVAMAVLLFNSTLLCGSNGGSRVLATGKVLLWLSFTLIVSALILCLVSMGGSL
jgi:hypothetical protein